MPDDDDRRRRDAAFEAHVDRRARRKRWAREQDRGVWFGLGMFGVVGWSVALPTVAGVTIGVWLDARTGTGTTSWTLTMMGVGLAVGCLIAWQWVRREGDPHRHRAPEPGSRHDSSGPDQASSDDDGPGDAEDRS